MTFKIRWFVPAVLAALAVAAPAFGADEKGSSGKADEAKLEAQLAAARQRLEAAAREVAELSGQITGPMTRNFMVSRMGSRAMLGVGLGEEPAAGAEGVAIESVTPQGPASEAGLKAGDVLVSVDGKSLRSTKDAESGASVLVRHMRSVKPGDKVKVEYLRGGKKHTAEVVAEAMNAERFVRYMPRDRMMAVPGVAVAPGVPPMPPAPFTMAFRGFSGPGLHDLELVTLTPKLGQYFGTDKGVLVVRSPRESQLKLEEGDVIVDIDGRAPQSGTHAMRILRSYQPGETVNVNVLRNRKNVRLQYEMPKRTGDARWLEGEPFEADLMYQDFEPGIPGIRVEKAVPAAPADST